MTLGEKAKKKAQYILKNHECENLPKDVLEQINSTIKKAEQESE